MNMKCFLLRLLGKGKQNAYDKLSFAFPVSMKQDVKAVAKLLSTPDKKIFRNRNFYINNMFETYSLSDGSVTLPYRCYFNPLSLLRVKALTELQKKIYACASLLHPDGYFREKQLRYLLEYQLEEWMVPFLLKISSEYVKELLTAIFEARKDQDNIILQKFCQRNPKQAQRCYSRMTSYWGEYYRGDEPHHPCVINGRKGYRTYIGDYVGYKLFRMCWKVSPRRRS